MRPTILLLLVACLLVACRGPAPVAGTIVPMAPPAAADAPLAPPARSVTTPTAPPIVQTAPAAAWAATTIATMAQPTPSPLPSGPTPIRTPMPPPAKPTVALVQMTPPAVDAQTSSLGRSKAEWEQTYGPPAANGTAANGRLRAGFEHDRLVQIEWLGSDREPRTMEVMTGALAPLLPSDTVPLRPIVLGDSIRGERYRSAWLARTIVGAAADSSDAREDFFVLYRLDATGSIASAIVVIGQFS